jgi:hypothetical protein
MIDLDYAKRHLKTSIVSLPTYQFRELIEALEEAKQIMQLNRAAFSTKQCSAEIEWLSKYFEQSLNEDQVEVERLSHENE